MISYILPTRNRPECLEATLRGLGALDPGAHDAVGGAEVIVVDNASTAPPRCPSSLDNGIEMRIIRRSRNEGAAARNVGAEAARGEWIVMLDDDSHPLDAGHVRAIVEAPEDVAAIGAEITLADGRREAGGLPEVFIGCGVAIRREAYLACAGYDPGFHFYVEEYDLAAKLILRGWRIAHDRRFRVIHEKTASGRDMNMILRRLVRNNGWVMQRYAPGSERRRLLRETLTRYRSIAAKERARRGYSIGAIELAMSLRRQARTPMSRSQFDRFTGLEAARRGLAESAALAAASTAAIVDPGKNEWAVRAALHELNVRIVGDEREADALVIGTLSPGPMMDAWERRLTLGQPVVRPWSLNEPSPSPEPALQSAR
ncbi:MAG: glycosyltransferase [Phycisphaeraceae bacterium]|nr:MAG: glycosyltransferase [Phycisphaeraceae bacterium]